MTNKFVFVTPAFNCQDDITQTIHSMMSQSYKNWRAIIINDISTDKTLETIKAVTAGTVFADRFTVIDNLEKMGEVRNTLQAIDQIDDDEIVCRVDGGDWLTENDTLWMLDTVYKNDAVDVVWTSHRWSYTPQNISGPLSLSERQTVYQHPWVSSHMKTFRCKRLRSVPDGNFRDVEGNYITIACDQAVFLPMMHMSLQEKRLVGHLPVVCYHYSIDLHDKNLFTSDRSIRQKNSAEWIRSRGFVYESSP
jgi:glycosyltransferase involved in cell wall biosynthesis